MYDLQTQSDQTDSEPESTSDDSDGESSGQRGRRQRRSSRRLRSGRKCMSIITSRYFDVPRLPPEFEREIALEHDDDDGCGHGHGHMLSGTASGKKRRFFDSGAVWDPVKRVIVERARAGVQGYEHARVMNGVPSGFGVGVNVGDRDGDQESREEEGEDSMEMDVEPEADGDDD